MNRPLHNVAISTLFLLSASALAQDIARTSLVIDPPNGRIPVKEGSPQDWRALMLARSGVDEFDGPEVRTVGERCLLSVLSTAGWATL